MRHNAVERVGQGAFAATGGTCDTYELTIGDGQVNMVDHRFATFSVAKRKIFYFDHDKPFAPSPVMLQNYFLRTAFRMGVRIAAAIAFMAAVPRTITAYIPKTAITGTPLMPAPTIRAKQ